jgi:hypothetical protein
LPTINPRSWEESVAHATRNARIRRFALDRRSENGDATFDRRSVILTSVLATGPPAVSRAPRACV